MENCCWCALLFYTLVVNGSYDGVGDEEANFWQQLVFVKDEDDGLAFPNFLSSRGTI